MRRRLPFMSRRANYTMLMGVVILVVLGFAALAVDISLIAMAEMQVQATADSASHAALVAHRNSVGNRVGAANDAAEFMLARNGVALGTADLDDIRFGTYNIETQKFCNGCGLNGTVNAVEVDISRNGNNSMGLFLAPLFGVNNHDVAASSTTAQQQRAIMLVQDFSCSMNRGDYPRPIDVSRRASLLFLDYMSNYNQSGDMLGLAGYAEWGVLGPSRNDPLVTGGGGASIGGLGGFFQNLVNLINQLLGRATSYADRPFAELSSVAHDQQYLRNMFAGICSTDHGCPDDPITGSTKDTLYPSKEQIGVCTNPSIAMDQAVEQLTTKTDPSYFRGIVVMSDGAFNCSGGVNAATAVANRAFDQHGIHVWTVLFHDGNNSAAQMKQITRGYGTFSQSPNVDDLPDIYAAIAASLPTAIVE
ncbi:MAG: Tad domain-containing protein [Myxococcota bacterium]